MTRRRWTHRPTAGAGPAGWAASTGPWTTDPPPDPRTETRARRRARAATAVRAGAGAVAALTRLCADTILDGGCVWVLLWLLHAAWQTPVPGYGLAAATGLTVRAATTRQPFTSLWRTPRDRWRP